MGRIERRSFGQYGLPRVIAFRQHFWIGAVAGFLAISTSLLCVFMLHGYRITALAIHSSTMVSAAVAWGVAFVILGLAEEFGRGYLQFTLTTGMGFWPSAILLSVWFALVHIGPNETKFGVFSVLLFAFLFCLFLRRTGTLWWAGAFTQDGIGARRFSTVCRTAASPPSQSVQLRFQRGALAHGRQRRPRGQRLHSRCVAGDSNPFQSFLQCESVSTSRVTLDGRRTLRPRKVALFRCVMA